jgi:hypothetical protein
LRVGEPGAADEGSSEAVERRPRERRSGGWSLLRGGAAVALLASLVVCDRAPEPLRPEASPTAPVDLTTMPSARLEECLRTNILAEACARLVPLASAPYRGGAIDFFTEWFAAFDLSARIRSEDGPGRQRPPYFVHIAIEAGTHEEFLRLAASRDVFRLQPGPPTWRRDVDTLLDRRRDAAVRLPTPNWDAPRGSLYLFPGYPTGGMLGDHLVYVWSTEDAHFAVSLHAWSPIEETAATLGAMIESIPPP